MLLNVAIILVAVAVFLLERKHQKMDERIEQLSRSLHETDVLQHNHIKNKTRHVVKD